MIVSCPIRAPAVAGLNCTWRVRVCDGFSVTGRLCAIENPAPLMVAEFTVTGEVPLEVKIRDCVVAVFSATLPKLTLAALMVSWGELSDPGAGVAFAVVFAAGPQPDTRIVRQHAIALRSIFANLFS